MSDDFWGGARLGAPGQGHDNDRYVRPFGTADDGEFAVAVTPTATNPVTGWDHTRLRVAVCAEGGYVDHDSGDEETLVVPLVGSFHVEVTEADGATHAVTLAGRQSVFAGATDVVYAGRGSRLRVRLVGPDAGRVALCGAVATKAADPKPFRHVTAPEVPVELRGTGRASREVRNLGLPDVLDADSILVCEVLTPAGNWSSWPPHKHDEERPGEETALEEIYYVETRSTDPRGTDPVGYLRVYGTAGRPLDVVAEVRTMDVVLVPHGWHGPAIASPDADLYYLNVMAGPGPERAWRICDDPAHAWVRETWADDDVDPRLPVGGTR
jgi:5-deoxy-glucuronate isomerase